MQALWRVQAHMLARIVVEIRAADIAVELDGTVVYRDVFMLTTATSFPVAPECLYFKSFLRYICTYMCTGTIPKWYKCTIGTTSRPVPMVEDVYVHLYQMVYVYVYVRTYVHKL